MKFKASYGKAQFDGLETFHQEVIKKAHFSILYSGYTLWQELFSIKLNCPLFRVPQNQLFIPSS